MSVRDRMADAAATHDPVRIVPGRDPMGAYRMLVPRSWGAASRLGMVELERGRPEPIGFFVESDRDGAAAIVVTQARLPVQLRLEDYVRGQCAYEGWDVLAVRWVEVGDNVRLTVLATKEGAVRRDVAFVDHARVFQHSSTSSMADWARLDHALWCSAVSFELLLPTGRRLFEAAREHAMLEGSVSLPRTWTCEVRFESPDVVALDANLDVDGWRGFVRVEARREDTPQPEHDLLRIADEEIVAAGIVPALRKPPVQWRPDVDVQGVFSSSVNLFGQLGEGWYGFVYAGGIQWSVIGISRPIETDRQGCMRMRGAFELALMTLQANERG
ncbi:MAG: hypothetical protein KUG77_09300 [Nannocystaceae bacterium]|nr:hypothetical protein [Nannocystaceae bacterium]